MTGSFLTEKHNSPAGTSVMTTTQAGVVLQHIRKLAGANASGHLGDRQLLERFTTGREEGAFEALMKRHGSMVYGVCRRVLGNAHDAEDAFQATFLVLARRANTIGRCGVGRRLAVSGGVSHRPEDEDERSRQTPPRTATRRALGLRSTDGSDRARTADRAGRRIATAVGTPIGHRWCCATWKVLLEMRQPTDSVFPKARSSADSKRVVNACVFDWSAAGWRCRRLC